MFLKITTTVIIIWAIYFTSIQKTLELRQKSNTGITPPKAVLPMFGPSILQGHHQKERRDNGGKGSTSDATVVDEINSLLMKERRIPKICTMLPLLVISNTIILMMMGMVLALTIYSLATSPATMIEAFPMHIQQHQMDAMDGLPTYEEAMRMADQEREQ